MFTSDYEKKTYKQLAIKFLWQFSLFIVSLVVCAAIFYGIEKNYDDDDFNYPHHVSGAENWTALEMYLNDQAAVSEFAKKFKVPKEKLLEFTMDMMHEVEQYYIYGLNHHTDPSANSHELSDQAHKEDAHTEDPYNASDEWNQFHDGATEAGSYEDQYYEGYEYDNIKDHGMTYLEAYVLTFSTFTTIGWGHVAPFTTGGKAFNVLVALLGIPLTLIMIISGCHLYMRVNKAILWKLLRKVTRMNEDRICERVNFIFKYYLILVFFTCILLFSLIIAKLEDFKYTDGLWYAFMSVTTVGFGDVVEYRAFEHDKIAKKAGQAIFMTLWIVTGFVTLGSVVLAFLYNYNRNQAIENQFYKKNEAELVDDTDDYDGGDVIYTGE